MSQKITFREEKNAVVVYVDNKRIAHSSSAEAHLLCAILHMQEGILMTTKLIQKLETQTKDGGAENYVHDTLYRIWRLIDANEPVKAVQAIQAMLVATQIKA